MPFIHQSQFFEEAKVAVDCSQADAWVSLDSFLKKLLGIQMCLRFTQDVEKKLSMRRVESVFHFSIRMILILTHIMTSVPPNVNLFDRQDTVSRRLSGKITRMDNEPEPYQLTTAISDVDRVCQEMLLLDPCEIMPDIEVSSEEVDELPLYLHKLFGRN